MGSFSNVVTRIAATYAATYLQTTSELAFYLLAVTNARAFIGRLLPGLFPKPFATIEALILASIAAGIAVLAWMGVYNLAGFIVFCVAFGVLSGMIITLTTVMAPMLLPETLQGKVGMRLGMAYAGCGMGILIGSPIAGAASHTTVGDFRGAQIWGGATLLLGSAFISISLVNLEEEKRVTECEDEKLNVCTDFSVQANKIRQSVGL